jgi:dolichol-phosphate mannosyltransferase
VADRAPIGHIFIMERGEPLQVRTRRSEGVERLIENTDDAYGFPPFATFAPQIRIGARDYEALRRREVQLLRRAIAGAAIWRVRVPGHEWAEVLPEIVARNGYKPRRAVHVGAPEPQLHALPVMTPTSSDELAADRVPI